MTQNVPPIPSPSVSSHSTANLPRHDPIPPNQTSLASLSPSPALLPSASTQSPHPIPSQPTVRIPSPTTARLDPNQSSSPSGYESPSPPTSASLDFGYGAIQRHAPTPGSPILDIPYQPRFVRVHPEDTAHFITDSSATDYSQEHHNDLAHIDSTHIRRRLMDTYILGTVIVTVTSVVFVIIVSGLTTMLARRSSAKLQLFSDWSNGGLIPLKYGCHAPNGHPLSIPLRWENIPPSATTVVILFANSGSIHEASKDPVHWFVTNISLSNHNYSLIPPNASANPNLLPPGTVQRPNTRRDDGLYWPPCSNSSGYFMLHLYAIEATPTIEDVRDAREIMMRFDGVPVAKLTGIYGQPSRYHPADPITAWTTPLTSNVRQLLRPLPPGQNRPQEAELIDVDLRGDYT